MSTKKDCPSCGRPPGWLHEHDCARKPVKKLVNGEKSLEHVPLSRENAPWVCCAASIPIEIYLERKLTAKELKTVRFDIFMGRACAAGQPEKMARFTHKEFTGGARFGTIWYQERNHHHDPKAPKATP